MNKSGHSLKSGYLDVGDGYALFYETYGNPEGIDVLFLHGGPGSGYSEKDKRFFDPAIFHVIFFDQRGAPRSKPAGSLEDNTAAHLVEDVLRLLDFLEVPKPILFGGSWGSTLALLFAIKYPERVRSMVLRGVFLGTRAEIDHFFTPQGAVAHFFPEAWERFIAQVPDAQKEQPVNYYLEQMLSDEEEVRKKYLYEWEYYGLSTVKLENSPSKVQEMLQGIDYGPTAKLVAYYSIHNCFLEDNFILDNAHIIATIPISIVHGRYDIICPPVYTYRLYQKLENAQLFLVQAGHLASEPAIEEQLITELSKHAKM